MNLNVLSNPKIYRGNSAKGVESFCNTKYVIKIRWLFPFKNNSKFLVEIPTDEICLPKLIEGVIPRNIKTNHQNI
jgi:hypothetical protein